MNYYQPTPVTVSGLVFDANFVIPTGKKLVITDIPAGIDTGIQDYVKGVAVSLGGGP